MIDPREFFPLSSLCLLKALESTVTNSTVTYGNDY